MRIALHKVSDERHVLEIVRGDGRRESMECETRSYLVHDLLHYATEAEAAIEHGVWGSLAAGKTLAELNDRTGQAMTGAPELMLVEKIVGVLSASVKGRAADEIVAGLEAYATQLGWQLPPWLTADFVAAVQERMRKLLGHWAATGYGGSMELIWPAS